MTQEIQQFYIELYDLFDQITFQILSIMKVRLTIYGCITQGIFIQTVLQQYFSSHSSQL